MALRPYLRWVERPVFNTVYVDELPFAVRIGKDLVVEGDAHRVPAIEELTP